MKSFVLSTLLIPHINLTRHFPSQPFRRAHEDPHPLVNPLSLVVIAALVRQSKILVITMYNVVSRQKATNASSMTTRAVTPTCHLNGTATSELELV